MGLVLNFILINRKYILYNAISTLGLRVLILISIDCGRRAESGKEGI